MDKNFEIGEQNKQEKKKRKKGLTSQKVKSLYKYHGSTHAHTVNYEKEASVQTINVYENNRI